MEKSYYIKREALEEINSNRALTSVGVKRKAVELGDYFKTGQTIEGVSENNIQRFLKFTRQVTPLPLFFGSLGPNLIKPDKKLDGAFAKLREQGKWILEPWLQTPHGGFSKVAIKLKWLSVDFLHF